VVEGLLCRGILGVVGVVGVARRSIRLGVSAHI